MCHVPDIHIYLSILRLNTIVSCHAYCSDEAELDIMGCSLFCHIVASYSRARGGWTLNVFFFSSSICYGWGGGGGGGNKT